MDAGGTGEFASVLQLDFLTLEGFRFVCGGRSDEMSFFDYSAFVSLPVSKHSELGLI